VTGMSPKLTPRRRWSAVTGAGRVDRIDHPACQALAPLARARGSGSVSLLSAFILRPLIQFLGPSDWDPAFSDFGSSDQAMAVFLSLGQRRKSLR
jgi:hypothetical protein